MSEQDTTAQDITTATPGGASRAPGTRTKSGYRRLRKEDHEYHGMVRRMIRGYGRRVQNADPTVLAEMTKLHDDLEAAIGEAARSLNAQGFSWADIGRELGIERQNAMRRYRLKDEDAA